MDVIVRELTEELKALEVKKMKAETRSEIAVFFRPLHYKRKKEEARTVFWGAVRKEWPDMIDLDLTLRYDGSIVAIPYVVGK